MDVKTIFFNGSLEEENYVIILLVLYQKVKRTKYVILNVLSMVSSSLLKHDISDYMKVLFHLA